MRAGETTEDDEIAKQGLVDAEILGESQDISGTKDIRINSWVCSEDEPHWVVLFALSPR
jgi:hypothetical protein